jgi:hypothetical protein
VKITLLVTVPLCVVTLPVFAPAGTNARIRFWDTTVKPVARFLREFECRGFDNKTARLASGRYG